MQNASVSAAFNAWVEVLDKALQREKIIGRTLRRWSYVRQHNAFESWCANVFDARRERNILARHRSLTLHRLTVAAFNRWLDYIDYMHYRYSKLWRAVRHLERLRMILVAKKWHNQAYADKCQRVALQRFIVRQNRVRQAAVWDKWLDIVDDRHRFSADLRHCLVRKRIGMRFFLRWYWDAFDKDIQHALCTILGRTEGTIEQMYAREKNTPAGKMREQLGLLADKPVVTQSMRTNSVLLKSDSKSPRVRKLEPEPDDDVARVLDLNSGAPQTPTP